MLHLSLALVQLPLQGLHAQRQLGKERERQGVRGERRRSPAKMQAWREAGQAGVAGRGFHEYVGLQGSSFVYMKQLRQQTDDMGRESGSVLVME